MYNRYIRNDNGVYTRIPQEEASSSQPHPPQAPDSPPFQTADAHAAPSSGGAKGRSDGLTGFLQHILDQLHLDHVDTGDLLLLGLLFFLFREDADEELLVALGLLLIL